VSTTLLNDGSLADKVVDGVRKIMYEITYVQVDEDYDPATGETMITRTPLTCQGMRDMFGTNVISDGLAKRTDVKFIVLQNTLTDGSGNEIEPDGNDEIKLDGTTYSIINDDTSYGIQQDPASAIYEIQGRG